VKLEEKKRIVDELHEKFKKAQIVIATDNKGLNVESLTRLRKTLSEANIEYKVVKNTLLTRASDNTQVSVIKDYFKGPSAVALSYGDVVVPAKILKQFAEENSRLEIKVAAMDGKALDFNAIKALSLLPSKEVLLAQMLGVLNAIPAKFVRTLYAVPSGLMNVLQAIKKQKEEQVPA
jgi:large subunit ribosomal protein L10